MKPPTSQKWVHHFIGVANYCLGMCSRRLHTLAPWTNIMCIKVKFRWTKIEQGAFGEIKRIVACNTLLDYADLPRNIKFITMIVI